jgi:alkanesulfonate monooxygenase SsuD/methylene tetrahydromethanopterin reductase-like flavin-dependent oxidoreductase (luciferase family)
VQYGLSLPTGGECGDPRFLVDLAERAEAAGWDGLFLEDYVCYGGDRVTPTCNVWAHGGDAVDAAAALERGPRGSGG